MPLLTRMFVRTALLYLLLAAVSGAFILAGQTSSFWAVLPGLQPVYFHLFMVGWVTQLIFGIAWWMFPVLSRDKPRGNEKAIWFVYLALNAGLIMRVVSEPLYSLNTGVMWRWLMLLSAGLQVAACWTFAAHLWRRVKGVANQGAGNGY